MLLWCLLLLYSMDEVYDGIEILESVNVPVDDFLLD